MSGVWYLSEWEMAVRLLLAASMGGMIGLEREWNNHAAGFRTHILVCIGSCVIMLLSVYGFGAFAAEQSVRLDPARLAAQAISGIGFLGAGAILRNGSSVSGLTTAASIWVVAAIGLCVGAGFFFVAAVATVLVLISLFVLNKMEKIWIRRNRAQEIELHARQEEGLLSRTLTLFEAKGVAVYKFQVRSSDDDAATKLLFSFRNQNAAKLIAAAESLSSAKGIISLTTSVSPDRAVKKRSGADQGAKKHFRRRDRSAAAEAGRDETS